MHLEPRYAPELEPFIAEFADIRVLIDHLGRPFQGTAKEYAVIVRWARFPNTVMKLSAIPAKETYPHRDVAPVIRELADAYGPDRLMYGGGFGAGVTAESYRHTRDQAAAYLSFLPEADRAKVLGGTAARFFRFGG